MRLSYSIEGEGPPVILIQGVGLPGRAWLPQIEALRERFTVITFDNRGVGGSDGGPDPLTIDAMAADAAAILQRENIDRVHVIGHSMGGLIALRFALMNPARIKSLILACSVRRRRRAGEVLLEMAPSAFAAASARAPCAATRCSR